MKNIAIIHYGLGNLRSVYNAFEHIGAAPYIAENPGDLKRADAAVLPGVGAFGDGMECLHKNAWVPAILDFAIEQERPFLGVCLGMQLLAEMGTEFGECAGLGLIGGTVIRLTSPSKDIRIPHVGWNNIDVRPGKKMYEGISSPLDFYFVHSYYLHTNDNDLISGTSHHGQDFVASVEKDNVWGVQYHPEKSQRAGLALLQNFLKV